jgi:hypothetical protein
VAAAALVLLAACGDGSGTDSSAASTGAENSAAETSAATEQDDFCTQAAAIDERVDAALSDLGSDTSIEDLFRQLAEEIRAVEPPEEIAADWETQADGLDRIAEALPEIDFTDPESLATLDEIDGELTAAGDNVTNYLDEQC